MDNKKQKSSLDVEHFSELLLASLANNTMVKIFSNPDIKTACLPFDYKDKIEKIVNDKSFLDLFLDLINLEEYQKNQLSFEKSLSESVSNELKKLGKKVEIDIEQDMLYIRYTSFEVGDILSKYDESTIQTMNHFASLINNYAFSREFVIQQRYNNDNKSDNLVGKVLKKIQRRFN